MWAINCSEFSSNFKLKQNLAIASLNLQLQLIYYPFNINHNASKINTEAYTGADPGGGGVSSHPPMRLKCRRILIMQHNCCLKTVHTLIVCKIQLKSSLIIGITKFSFRALHGRGHTLILSHPLHHNYGMGGGIH